MPNKADLKAVGIVVIGVMIAGFAMYQLRDLDAVDSARSGFGG